MANYSVSTDKRELYAGLYLLEYIINGKGVISTLLSGDEQDLEPILEWLMARDYIEIKGGNYCAAEKGYKALSNFMAQYSEFLQVFDVYCAVDLEAGEFAFAKYYDFETGESWRAYLNQDIWEDLRIAVAEFKKIDTVEIVFMSFINEGRFGRDKTGWQFDLLLGTVWDDITEICQTALKVDDLGYEDDQGFVSGEDVICDIIEQGTALMQELNRKGDSYMAQHESSDTSFGKSNPEEDRETVVVTEYYDDYYEPYYDPFYISPVWMCLLLF